MNNEQINPFDDHARLFFVLVNSLGQYSLWPEFAALPAGWKVELGPESYDKCQQHVEEHWQDIRPVASMA